jgi:proteasome assembly chaperone (PAC2) family protein
MQICFLGKPLEYWIELDKRANNIELLDYIQEIAELRSKVSFYESRLKQMNDFMNKINSKQENK